MRCYDYFEADISIIDDEHRQNSDYTIGSYTNPSATEINTAGGLVYFTDSHTNYAGLAASGGSNHKIKLQTLRLNGFNYKKDTLVSYSLSNENAADLATGADEHIGVITIEGGTFDTIVIPGADDGTAQFVTAGFTHAEYISAPLKFELT